ncbi:hypothetical protein, partial [Streptomyces sp. AcH 505]|uniref:hypothetical protein n=1 Tax=Streptomyces sp. AcH 505 TaxID=352211 RepID=UPI0019D6B255
SARPVRSGPDRTGPDRTGEMVPGTVARRTVTTRRRAAGLDTYRVVSAQSRRARTHPRRPAVTP